MSEYLSPGVYIEEFEIGARPIEGVSTSTAGFLGETERGPTTPRLITSWLQYQRVFGGYFGNDKYLPGAVDGFFKNEGARCYIARIVKSGDNGATLATLKLKSIDKIDPNKLSEFKDKILRVEALGEGKWGNNVAIRLSKGTLSGVKLNSYYWKTNPPSFEDLNSDTKGSKDLSDILKKQPPTVIETFDDVEISETSPNFFEKTVNSISNLIKISIDHMTDKNTHGIEETSDDPKYLTDGADSKGVKARLKLKSIDQFSNVNEFKDKILILEALIEGDSGNNNRVVLSKGSKGGIRLDVFDFNPNKFDNLLPNGKPPKLDSISISVEAVTEENKKDAKQASENPFKLEGGANAAKASLKLIFTDQTPLIVNGFTDKILKLKAVKEGDEGNNIAVGLSKGSDGGIKLNISNPQILDNVLPNEPFPKSDSITISIEAVTEENKKDAKQASEDSFKLEGGANAAKASLKLIFTDQTPLIVNEFTDKIMKLEAVKEGDVGNNIAVGLSKGSEGGIKLNISNPQILDNVLPNEPFPKSDSITISIEAVTEENKKDAKPASEDPFKLEGGANAAKASLKLIFTNQTPLIVNEFTDKILKLEAIKEGDVGNNIAVGLSKGSKNGMKLDVYPYYEIFDNILPDQKLPQSKLITALIENATEENSKDAKPASADPIILEGGKNPNSPEISKLKVGDYLRTDSDKPGERRGLTAFTEIEDISIVYAPNVFDPALNGLADSLISHCENLKYRFAILDAPQGSSNVSNLDPRSKNPTDFAAFYYPWIKVINPETGTMQLMPPGGHIAGIYARNDVERGVHKAPANEVVLGASDLEFQIMKGEQDVLNPRGVNVIRAFSGRGILLWGARTLSSNTLWKYINLRRLFIYVEASIEIGTQWVVFEPNNERLWARVKATITQFLTGVWRSGALMGTTPEQAFFVKCDRSTMTQDDIDNGRLVCIIGIAPVKPAEYVIFRIAQWQGGSAAME